MSDKIGLIVDGDGDYSSLKKRFKHGYRIVKTDGPRGHSAKIEDIVSRSKKQIKILKAFSCSRVVVVLDFEDRHISYENFIREVREAYKTASFEIPVFVAVPNKMIENWYLADIEEISRKKVFVKNGLRQKNYEGKHGKNEIKKCMANGLAYSETQHGAKMFEVLRFEIAKENSSSFADFLEFTGDCSSG